MEVWMETVDGRMYTRMDQLVAFCWSVDRPMSHASRPSSLSDTVLLLHFRCVRSAYSVRAVTAEAREFLAQITTNKREASLVSAATQDSLDPFDSAVTRFSKKVLCSVD